MPVLELVIAKRGPVLHKYDGAHGRETDWGTGHLNARGVTLGEFARVLESQLDRIVIDTTGLDGTFDFTLTWTPDLQRTERPIESIDLYRYSGTIRHGTETREGPR